MKPKRIPWAVREMGGNEFRQKDHPEMPKGWKWVSNILADELWRKHSNAQYGEVAYDIAGNVLKDMKAVFIIAAKAGGKETK